MAICGPAEDAISICLTAFWRLLQRFNLNVNDIGRIDVGSESNPDRAKAIKSHLLMVLGQAYVAGSDCVQACYGGTGALLNATAWLESSQWEARKYAVVVAGDVAVYDSGAARATGGAGAVALLLGRDCSAPIKICKKFGHFATNVYDFYKPNPFTEYPKVDGPLSISVYLLSALNAYADWYRKENENDLSDKTIAESFDQLIFHSPYAKIVYKAFYQLQLCDPTTASILKIETKVLEAKNLAEIDKLFKMKVDRNLILSKNLGNSYCASIFFNLLSCLIGLNERERETETETETNANTRIGVFSYGSGSMATFFALNCVDSQMPWLKSLGKDIQNNLINRLKVSPAEYEEIMKRRRELYGMANWMCSEGELRDLAVGTFYLAQIDSEHRRIYKQKL